MKKEPSIKSTFLKLCTAVILILLLIISAVEFVMQKNSVKDVAYYRIEISRVENEIRAHADKENFSPDLSAYETIRSVQEYDPQDTSAEPVPAEEFLESSVHYVLRNIGGRLYKIEYEVDLSKERSRISLLVHIAELVSVVSVILILVFIYFSIIRKFHLISDYPYELAKGNLTVPLKEDKNRLFGRFLWGLDMLREKLEQEKQKNLELQKEKSTILLALSHDIKTPLQAIRLYAAAMKKKLYKDPDRQAEIAGRIDDNAMQIEHYAAKITEGANEDFLSFDVKDGEFYLKDVLDYIRKYYSDKMQYLGIDFQVKAYRNLLLRGDPDRFTEVLQNIIENALKYGDGRRITVECGSEEDSVLVTVSNTGCTLPEHELEHIFESFYRGSNVGNKSGSGLGLYICRKLMILMKGGLFAEIDGDEMKVTAVCRCC